MKSVFVDTGGFFAHLDKDDDHNSDAKRIFDQARDEGWQLVTTNAVIFETHALIVARLSRDLGILFLDRVRELLNARPGPPRVA